MIVAAAQILNCKFFRFFSRFFLPTQRLGAVRVLIPFDSFLDFSGKIAEFYSRKLTDFSFDSFLDFSEN